MAFQKVKSRNFKLLLYPDNEFHMAVLSYIRKEYSYLEVYHNKDLKDIETGEIKKNHYHVYVPFGGSRWNTAFIDELDSMCSNDGSSIQQFVRPVPDEKRFLRYLIHKDSPEKFQYDCSCVTGTSDLLERFALACYGDTELINDSIVLANYIIDSNCQDILSFQIWALSNGYQKAYDRYKATYNLAINVNINGEIRKLKSILSDSGIIL